LDYATQQDVDLIAMGTHGRTGIERRLLGSVTERVVRLSDVPVLTVRSRDGHTATFPYSDVLLPTDGSEQAAAAVDAAADVAGTYDARLHVLSVIDTMSLGIDVRSADVAELLEEDAQGAVETVADEARAASVSAVETSVQYGHPYREINAYVDANDVDLVVMGTRGRSGLERYLLGSVTEKVVRTSSVPVMTVQSSTSPDGRPDPDSRP
jgi:nucleotide-binding universal stress UspA family protein